MVATLPYFQYRVKVVSRGGSASPPAQCPWREDGYRIQSICRISLRTEKIDSRRDYFLFQFLDLFQFLEPPGEKTALRFLPRQGKRLLIRSTRNEVLLITGPCAATCARARFLHIFIGNPNESELCCCLGVPKLGVRPVVSKSSETEQFPAGDTDHKGQPSRTFQMKR